MRIFTLLVSIITAVAVSFQVSASVKISGKAISSDEEALPGVSVLLKSNNDSIYSGTMTDENGLYAIDADIKQEASDSLYIEFAIQGFRNQRVDLKGLSFDKSIDVVMQPENKTLAEVVVKAYKKKLVIEPGKYIFNPKSVAHVAADARIMLKYVPLLTIDDSSGKMTIAGRPVKLQLNGFDCMVPVDQILAQLSALSPSEFKAIEIITNPGSSMASTSNMTILNIRYDFDMTGIYSNYRLDAGIADHTFSPRAMASAIIQKKNYSATIGLSGGLISTYDKEKETFEYLDKESQQIRITDKTLKSHNNYIGVNFDNAFFFKRKSFISFGANMSVIKGNSTNDISSKIISGDSYQDLPTTVNKIESPIGTPPFGTYLAGRWIYDDNNSKIDSKIFYFLNTADDRNTFTEEVDTSTGINYVLPVKIQDNSKRFSGITAEVAGTHYFKNGWGQLEYGYNYFHAYERSDLNADSDFESAKLTRDTHALYLSYQKSIGSVFSFRIGGREEYYYTKISNFAQMLERSRSDQWYFIPNIALTFSFADGRHQISVDAAEYLAMPRLDLLNPHKIWTSDNTYICGNPGLKAARDYYVTAKYTLYNDYSIAIGYDRVLDQSHNSTIETDTDGIFATKSFNSGSSTSISASFSYAKLLFGGFWNVRASIGAGYSWYSYGDNNRLNYFAWSISWYNTLLLSKRHNLYANISLYHSKAPETGYKTFDNRARRPFVNFSMTKKFPWGGTLDFSLNNLGMRSPDWKNVQDDYRYSVRSVSFPMSANITFTYNFGRGQVTKVAEGYSSNGKQDQNSFRNR